MSYYNLPRDDSFTPAAGFEIDGQPGKVMAGQIDQTTGRVLVDLAGGFTAQSDTLQSTTNGQTVFTLTYAPTFVILIVVNGQFQTPNVNYTISGSTLTLTNGIPANLYVTAVYTY